MRRRDTPLNEQQERAGESFLQRFHRRKLEARGLDAQPVGQIGVPGAGVPFDGVRQRVEPVFTTEQLLREAINAAYQQRSGQTQELIDSFDQLAWLALSLYTKKSDPISLVRLVPTTPF